MTDILYLDFLKEVIPYAPDMPELVASNAVRNAIIELCEQSHVWVHEPEPFDVVSGGRAYEIAVPLETAVAIFREVYIDGRAIMPLNPDQLRNNSLGTDWRDHVGATTGYTHQEPSTLLLYPTPDSDIPDGGKVIVALKPTRTSQRVSETLLDRWGEGIALGARSRLYEVPGIHQDLDLAAQYRHRFNSVISEARRTAYKGHTRAATYVSMPRIV